MTYEEWKTASEAARAKTDEASRIWNEVFPCNGKLPSDNAWMRKAARARRNR